MKKILCCFGTRPEFIKMYPVIIELKKSFEVTTVNTRQHKELLDGLMENYKFVPDILLDVMVKGQSLNSLTSKIIKEIDSIVTEYDLVIVQGDTSTAMCCALAAFNNGIKVAHIEAGLRSNDRENPFPEEVNRRIISTISEYNFCPNRADYDNIDTTLKSKNYIVGNTVIDMVKITKHTDVIGRLGVTNNNYVLVTCHRRENHSKMKDICEAIKHLSKENKIVFSVHMNPKVRDVIITELSNNKNITLVDGFDYNDMITIIANSKYIISDSGGIQEEAPTFGKFVYVLRDYTERNESVQLGFSILVGNDTNTIINAIGKHSNVSITHNPYGSGDTSCKIRTILEQEL